MVKKALIKIWAMLCALWKNAKASANKSQPVQNSNTSAAQPQPKVERFAAFDLPLDLAHPNPLFLSEALIPEDEMKEVRIPRTHRSVFDVYINAKQKSFYAYRTDKFESLPTKYFKGRTALARISQTERCIGALNLRKLFCENDLTESVRIPDADRV